MKFEHLVMYFLLYLNSHCGITSLIVLSICVQTNATVRSHGCHYLFSFCVLHESTRIFADSVGDGKFHPIVLLCLVVLFYITREVTPETGTGSIFTSTRENQIDEPSLKHNKSKRKLWVLCNFHCPPKKIIFLMMYPNSQLAIYF